MSNEHKYEIIISSFDTSIDFGPDFPASAPSPAAKKEIERRLIAKGASPKSRFHANFDRHTHKTKCWSEKRPEKEEN